MQVISYSVCLPLVLFLYILFLSPPCFCTLSLSSSPFSSHPWINFWKTQLSPPLGSIHYPLFHPSKKLISTSIVPWLDPTCTSITGSILHTIFYMTFLLWTSWEKRLCLIYLCIPTPRTSPIAHNPHVFHSWRIWSLESKPRCHPEGEWGPKQENEVAVMSDLGRS